MNALLEQTQARIPVTVLAAGTSPNVTATYALAPAFPAQRVCYISNRRVPLGDPPTTPSGRTQTESTKRTHFWLYMKQIQRLIAPKTNPSGVLGALSPDRLRAWFAAGWLFM